MIKLKRITFKNFKIFGGDPYTINFEDSHLILLDGPNGYGKTSVFDAIELSLTGNISRFIILENRQSPNDVVVAHKGNENVEITIEFIDKNSQVKIFQRKLKQNIPKPLKKISKFAELWDLYEIVNGDLINISQDALEKYFDSKDFSRDFLLFHYVQQEETSKFLKTNNEATRAQELSQLFGDTSQADENLNRLVEIQRKIGLSKKVIESKIQNIKDLYKLDKNNVAIKEDIKNHFYVFPWLQELNKLPPWDTVSITELNQEKLNNFLEEISIIKNLIKYQKFFLKSRSFEKVIQQREHLELYLGYYNSIKDHELYVAQSTSYQLIKSSYDVLSSGELEIIHKISNFDAIFQALGLENSNIFESTLQSLIEEVSKASGLSSIYTEIIKYRDAICSNLQKVPNESSCLLCGHDYQNHDMLIHAITHHSHLLRSELSGKDKFLVEARDLFNKIHLFPLLQACANYLERQVKLSPEDLLSLSKVSTNRDFFDRVHAWLLSEQIEHDDLMAENFPVQGGISYLKEATGKLCERIYLAIGTPPEGYYETSHSNAFDRIYRDYFNNEQEKLAQVTIDLLTKKESYITSLYFSSLTKITKELSELTRQQDLLNVAALDINGLITIVRTQIRQYRKKLITDIEIPFYIYSGKILQTHQAGLGHGVFIKDPTGEEELKNVRLVSNWESDHDILNTMSSGQISAVVIALTLALHRVYSTNFSTILIDDPVQTMDDINMSSLVEVLRNDFSKKQIILSTHEDKVARYFTYKFLKHSKNVKSVNLMQREEYFLKNEYLYDINS